MNEVWWRGRQWAVTETGIEQIGGDYYIETDSLALRIVHGLDDELLPDHMARKDWVDVADFTTVWMVALVLYGVAVSPDRVLRMIKRLGLSGGGEC